MSELERLFARATALEGAERERFLASQSEPVAGRLRALLAADAGAPSGFLSRPVAPLSGDLRRIGRYRLLSLLGEGGMGTVWLAEQEEPIRRLVALKTVRAGRADDAMLARMQAERQALALVNHPGIAQFHDGGATESGLPYFVMEYVEGLPLDRHCDERRLPLSARVALVAEVCDAVQHAHQKGILHRDLKCSNVLVAERDGRAAPKVIDFGIARALSGSLAGEPLSVAVVRVAGTRSGMSPEQARGEDVDTRADVFALGAILYELACGAPPFDAREHAELASEELTRLWLEREPPPPAERLRALGERAREVAERRATTPERLARALEGDVGRIAARALARDRAARYGAASELAADLRAFLAHEPVVAAPRARAYRARLFVRRHRLAVGLASALALATVLGLVVSLGLYARARADEERIATEATRALGVADVLERALEESTEVPQYAAALQALLDGPLSEVALAPGRPPGARAGVHTTIGRLLLRAGENERARDRFRAAEALQREGSGVGAYQRFETFDGLLQAERRIGGVRAAAPYVPQTLAAARDALSGLSRDEERALESLLSFQSGADVDGEELLRGLDVVLARIAPELEGRDPRSHALGRVVFETGGEMLSRGVPEAEAYLAGVARRAREVLEPRSLALFLRTLVDDLLEAGPRHRESARAYLAELDALLATLEPRHWLRDSAEDLRARLEGE